MSERLEALRARREWIPAENVEAIRQSNREIRELTGQIGEPGDTMSGRY